MIRTDPNIKFKSGLIDRPYTKRIVIHHSASSFDTTIQDIQRWHWNNGWSGVGYHFVIHSDGSIWEGRPLRKKGSHAYYDAQHDGNRDGIGICLVGNFMTDVPRKAQMDSLVWLIHHIWGIYPGLKVEGHSDVMPTACPGRNFPWAEVRERLLEGVVDVDKWMIEGGRAALAYLEKQGLVLNAADWGKEEKLGAATPQYLFWMLMQRLVERMEGK